MLLKLGTVDTPRTRLCHWTRYWFRLDFDDHLGVWALDNSHSAEDCSVVAALVVFFFQAEDGIRDLTVTGVQTCALPISTSWCGRSCVRTGPSVPRRGHREGLRCRRSDYLKSPSTARWSGRSTRCSAR